MYLITEAKIGKPRLGQHCAAISAKVERIIFGTSGTYLLFRDIGAHFFIQ